MLTCTTLLDAVLWHGWASSRRVDITFRLAASKAAGQRNADSLTIDVPLLFPSPLPLSGAGTPLADVSFFLDATVESTTRRWIDPPMYLTLVLEAIPATSEVTPSPPA